MDLGKTAAAWQPPCPQRIQRMTEGRDSELVGEVEMQKQAPVAVDAEYTTGCVSVVKFQRQS